MLHVSVEEEAAFLQDSALKRAKVLDIRNSSDMFKVGDMFNKHLCHVVMF